MDNAAVLGTAGTLYSLERFAWHLAQEFDRNDVVALADGGLLDLAGDWWHFRSDLVREVAYEGLTKSVRAQRHAGVAAALSDSATMPLNIVAHHSATVAELVDEIGPVDQVPLDMKSGERWAC